jgi:hypothetical protein
MRAVWKVRGFTFLLRVGLRGGAVTVSFSKYLPWQAMHFLQCSIRFSKTCCRMFAASFRRIVEQAVFLPRSSLFMVGKARKSQGARSGLHRLDGWVVGFLIHFFQTEHRIQSRNADAPPRKYLLPHPKNSSFQTTITLTTVRGMKITPLLRYPTTTTWRKSPPPSA